MAVKFDFGRLDQPFEADWPVTVSVPQDGGLVAEETFIARFRLFRSGAATDIVQTDPDGRELWRRFWVGFGAGEETEFTPELFAAMVDTPYVRSALLKAYQGFANGIAAKN